MLKKVFVRSLSLLLAAGLAILPAGQSLSVRAEEGSVPAAETEETVIVPPEEEETPAPGETVSLPEADPDELTEDTEQPETVEDEPEDETALPELPAAEELTEENVPEQYEQPADVSPSDGSESEENAAEEQPGETTGAAFETADTMIETSDEAPEEETEENDTPEETVEESERSEQESLPIEDELHTFGAPEGLPDNDDLFADYFDVLCRQEIDVAHQKETEPAYAPRRSTLTGMNLYLYDRFLPLIESVAAGTRTSTRLTVSLKDYFKVNDSYYDYYADPADLGLPSGITASELAARLDFDADTVIAALLYDCAYEMYWYDKTVGGSYMYPFVVSDGMVGYRSSMYIEFPVAAAYSSSGSTGTITTSASKCSAATSALSTARSYVNNARNYSDVEKIRYYYRTVFNLSDYNYEAGQSSSVPYGDPWQVIYLFDGDPNTKVVCEGYAKAFKLLCDLTTFSNDMFECYLVSGQLQSPSASGSHMWNIVRMDDGRYYLADITNDNDSYYEISGYTGVLNKGYRYGSLYYYYSSDMYSLFTNGELNMSASAYTGGSSSASIPVTGVQLDLGSLNTITLGPGATYQLIARVQPSDATDQRVTYSSSDTSVAAVGSNGVITAGKIGTAIVTVRTSQYGYTASCTVNVKKDGWYYENGNYYWYEKGVKQGTTGRGKEIYFSAAAGINNPGGFPAGWYWLDAVQGGARAVGKDVYQESKAGIWADRADGTGKWVRYDTSGQMVKGWQTVNGKTWYFDRTYGTMAKGYASVDGYEYYFDTSTGVLKQNLGTVPKKGWRRIGAKDYWYENYQRQGVSNVKGYRGKEIYFSGASGIANPNGLPAGWYWLDNIYGGAKAANKEVYMPYTINGKDNIGKWVRYDSTGQMIKGWYQTGSKRYYYDLTTGAMAKGWKQIGDSWYYFNTTTGVLE